MKTLLDVEISASKAALDSLDKTDALELSKFRHERFEKDKGKAADWEEWHRRFSEHREFYLRLLKVKSPSAALEAEPKPAADPAPAKPESTKP